MEFAVGPVPGVAEVVILRAYDRVDQALQAWAYSSRAADRYRVVLVPAERIRQGVAGG
jgi:hypothetical protein